MKADALDIMRMAPVFPPEHHSPFLTSPDGSVVWCRHSFAQSHRYARALHGIWVATNGAVQNEVRRAA